MAGRGEMMGCVCVDNNMVEEEEEDSGHWTLGSGHTNPASSDICI